jgi:hypothetical protein
MIMSDIGLIAITGNDINILSTESDVTNRSIDQDSPNPDLLILQKIVFKLIILYMLY